MSEMSQKLFIIHGWTYNLDKWAALSTALRANDIEPVLLKVPGLTADSDKVWTIDDYIEWLKQQLSQDKQPVVLGHSNGGRIALAFAQKYPGVLKQLILIDSAGIPNDHYWWARLKLSVLRVLSKIGKPLARVKPLHKIVYKVIGAQDYHDAAPNMKQTMSNMLEADKTIDLTQIQVPVNLIWGSDDTVTPLRDAKLMLSRLPSARLDIVKGAKHTPQATHTDETTRLILQALRGDK